MSGPAWLVGILAGIMATTALYACARLLAAWRWGRRLHYGIDVTHVLMGTAMGGMLVPSLDFLPEIAWLFVFAVMSAWFSWTTLQFVVRRGIRGEDERPRAPWESLPHALCHGLQHVVHVPCARKSTRRRFGDGHVSGRGRSISVHVAFPVFHRRAFRICRLGARPQSETG